MSTVELQQNGLMSGGHGDLKPSLITIGNQQHQPSDKQQHPLHQFDLTVMSRFYDACVQKLSEREPRWSAKDWKNVSSMPSNLNADQRADWPNPMVLSHKQRVYDAFARLARESGEPMILMPNFDYGDIINFEKFLQALKQDGVNAIGRYKQYLNNKDMRKFEIDLVVLHAKYGVLLVECKECDHLDNKRRSRARLQLTSARTCFESMARLIFEAKGWQSQEASLPLIEVIALPKVNERPLPHQKQQPQSQQLETQGGNQNQSASSTTSTGGHQQHKHSSRLLSYLIKSDLKSTSEFKQWWTKNVVEPRQEREKMLETEGRVNKFDVSVLNWMTGLIKCIRDNLIMPVVYPENGTMFTDNEKEKQHLSEESGETKDEDKFSSQFQQALNVYGEFFQAEHESVRSLSKVLIASSDAERIRKTICLQTLWLLLNDSQKKISVVCSEMNKPYYEEFFARQRKLYNNLNNVRFYTDLHSCAVNGGHTIKRDGEIWFFDSGINGTLSDIVERLKELNAYWIFTTQEEALGGKHKQDWETNGVKVVRLEEPKHRDAETLPWLSGQPMLKFPMRLHCDLLIVGDLISLNQMKLLYKYLKSNQVANQSQSYQNSSQSMNNLMHYQYQPNSSNNNHSQYYQQLQQQQLQFNPTKKFKTIKFIRGGSIDNLRSSLKMHDSIQASCVLMHVGDEDLFKTHNSVKTVERVREMAMLVKEYCPKSFVVLSTLMRRNSRTENSVAGEVNKGIINFCKQTKDTLNCFYMLNNHFEPEFHTQEGRSLSNKGLRLYMENLLFVVDYFLIRNNKQH